MAMEVYTSPSQNGPDEPGYIASGCMNYRFPDLGDS